jgi:hypothetical protein
MPNVDFKSKWFFMQALPMSAMSLFGLLHIVQYLRKRCLLGRSKKLNSHVPALVGTSLVMMYYLYLNLTRGVLDIFNCQPTTPPDGHLYLRECLLVCSCLFVYSCARCWIVSFPTCPSVVDTSRGVLSCSQRLFSRTAA